MLVFGKFLGMRDIPGNIQYQLGRLSLPDLVMLEKAYLQMCIYL